MNKTPLQYYFSVSVSAKLKKLFAIKSMEQLICLSQRTNALKGIAKEVGMKEDDFEEIVRKARNILGMPERSGRKYPLGSLHPDAKISR